MRRVRVSPPVRVFLLPVSLPIPGTTQSHSITLVQEELLIVSMRIWFMVSLHLTLSLSPLIALLRRGLSKSPLLEILFMTSEAYVKRGTICL